jgi:hypothetical protein
LKTLYNEKTKVALEEPLFIRELLSFAPNLIYSKLLLLNNSFIELPFIDIEDYITLIDSTVIVTKPLSVIYYIVLDLLAFNVDLAP